MKTKDENKKLPAGSDLGIPHSELDENQEFDRSEYEEDNFYSFVTEDYYNLADDISKWESLRWV